MKYPKFLSKDGKIGVCAPSFGSVIEPYVSRMNNAIKTFNKLGHEVVLTDGVRKQYKASSDTGENRAKEFMELYNREDVDVIISEAGGEVEYEILKYLDFNKLKESSPKWFQGYSDNTILTFLLTTLADTASIYGVNKNVEFGVVITTFKPFNYLFGGLNQGFVIVAVNGVEVKNKYELDSQLARYEKKDNVCLKVIKKDGKTSFYHVKV